MKMLVDSLVSNYIRIPGVKVNNIIFQRILSHVLQLKFSNNVCGYLVQLYVQIYSVKLSIKSMTVEICWMVVDSLCIIVGNSCSNLSRSKIFTSQQRRLCS